MAAEFLIEKVWPRLQAIIPSARLIIAGAHPERIRDYGTNIPGITISGFVDDLDELYRKVRIVCVPIFAGGGTRIKIIEAAAYGKPVVATRIGAEGLCFRDGRELLLRDDPESLVEALSILLRNHQLCESIGSAAHTKAIEHYDRNNIVKRIRTSFEV